MPPRLTALFQAIADENLTRLDRTLMRRADVEQVRPDTDRTPLLTAAQKGWSAGVIRLLDAGACPDTIDGNGFTPLMHLVRYDLSQVQPAMDRLLEAGARLDRVTLSQEHVLSVAASGEHVPTLRWLAGKEPRWINDLPSGSAWRPLELAAFGGWNDACTALLGLGALPNLHHRMPSPTCVPADPEGRAPREHADPQRLPIVSAGPGPLLDGSGVYDGWTPLHLAAAMGHLGVVQRLLDAGADPERITHRGKTVVDVARSYQRPAVIGVLEAHALRAALASAPDSPAPVEGPSIPSRRRL